MKMVIPKELSLPPVPPAAYRARIVEVKPKSSQDGKPGVQLMLQLLSEGPDPEFKTVGRKIPDFMVIQENTLWRANMPFKACTGNDFVAGTEVTVEDIINILIGSCAGRDVAVNIVIEDYEGSPRNKVKSYNPVK